LSATSSTPSENVAFIDRWIRAFASVYSDRPLGEVPWFKATAAPELCRLVIDGTIRPGSDVIDLGCGAGIESLFLARHGMSVTGIDAAPAALEVGEHLGKLFGLDVDWRHGDVLAIPCGDSCADVVTDGYVFHNVDPAQRERYAAEVERVLRPGGILVIRGFSDRMEPGNGPLRLTSSELFETFLRRFTCEHLERFRALPADNGREQWHWLSIWRLAHVSARDARPA
jgi:ubiquinone/menaquinone biosynthesis C-methylase UbiE